MLLLMKTKISAISQEGTEEVTIYDKRLSQKDSLFNLMFFNNRALRKPSDMATMPDNDWISQENL